MSSCPLEKEMVLLVYRMHEPGSGGRSPHTARARGTVADDRRPAWLAWPD